VESAGTIRRSVNVGTAVGDKVIITAGIPAVEVWLGNGARKAVGDGVAAGAGDTDGTAVATVGGRVVRLAGIRTEV